MMASSYTITTQTNALLLDVERRGLVVFTVANQTGRSVRARMSVSPFPPASEGWFWIEPEGNSSDRIRAVERLLPPGASETCNVRIEVTPDATPGAQAVRLDVVSVDRPDEEWAHGSAIGFEIPAPVQPPPPPPPGYIETVGGAVAGAIAAIALGSIMGLAIALVSGVDVPSSLTFGFATVFGGGLVAAAALGGAIGAFAALMVRAILRPEPWKTALAYFVLALVLGTVLQLVAALASPKAAQALLQPIDQIVIGSPIIFQTFSPISTGIIIRTIAPLTLPPVTAPPATTRPPTAAPTASPTPTQSPIPSVQKPDISLPITLALALVGTVLAAGAARAFTRWRDLGTL